MHAGGDGAARMRKRRNPPICRKIVVRLPDLEHAKTMLLKSLGGFSGTSMISKSQPAFVSRPRCA